LHWGVPFCRPEVDRDAKILPPAYSYRDSRTLPYIGLDETTARIVNAKALASHQTPSQIIAALFRKELTAKHTGT
jgi:hypothetical protein